MFAGENSRGIDIQRQDNSTPVSLICHGNESFGMKVDHLLQDVAVLSTHQHHHGAIRSARTKPTGSNGQGASTMAPK